MLKKYFINPFVVLFHTELDQKNNFTTIVFNPDTERVLKVNSFGYRVLKVIYENPGIKLMEISKLISVKPLKVGKFLETMIKENSVFEK